MMRLSLSASLLLHKTTHRWCRSAILSSSALSVSPLFHLWRAQTPGMNPASQYQFSRWFSSKSSTKETKSTSKKATNTSKSPANKKNSTKKEPAAKSRKRSAVLNKDGQSNQENAIFSSSSAGSRARGSRTTSHSRPDVKTKPPEKKKRPSPKTPKGKTNQSRTTREVGDAQRFSSAPRRATSLAAQLPPVPPIKNKALAPNTNRLRRLEQLVNEGDLEGFVQALKDISFAISSRPVQTLRASETTDSNSIKAPSPADSQTYESMKLSTNEFHRLKTLIHHGVPLLSSSEIIRILRSMGELGFLYRPTSLTSNAPSGHQEAEELITEQGLIEELLDRFFSSSALGTGRGAASKDIDSVAQLLSKDEMILLMISLAKLNYNFTSLASKLPATATTAITATTREQEAMMKERLQSQRRRREELMDFLIYHSVAIFPYQFNDAKPYVDYLTALALLKTPWKELPSESKSAILEKIEELRTRFQHSMVPSLIAAMSKLNIFLKSGSKLKATLWDLVKTSIRENKNRPDYPKEVGQMVYGLGKLQFVKERAYNPGFSGVIMEGVNHAWQQMSSVDITATLTGMGELNIEWQRDIPSALQAKINATLVKILSKIPLEGLSGIMNSLNQMNYQWKYDDNIIQVIYQSIFTHFHPSNQKAGKLRAAGGGNKGGHGMAQLIHLLGSSSSSSSSLQGQESESHRVVWSNLSPEIQESLNCGFEHYLFHLSPENIAKLYAGSANMEVDWSRDLSPQAQQGLIRPLLNNPPEDFIPEEIHTVFQSLALLGLNWHRDQHLLTAELKTHLFAIIQHWIAYFQFPLIADLIHSFGILEADYHEFPPKLIKQLLTHPKLMKLDSDLPMRQSAVATSFSPAGPSRIGSSVSKVFSGLSLMEISWHTLMNQDAAGKLGHSLVQMVEKAQTDLLPQDLGNIMYSTAMMSFDSLLESPSKLSSLHQENDDNSATAAPLNGAPGLDKAAAEERAQSQLLKMHQHLVQAYYTLRRDFPSDQQGEEGFSIEDLCQITLYFELLKRLPTPLKRALLHGKHVFPTIPLPQPISDPATLSPEYQQQRALVAKAIQEPLGTRGRRYQVEQEWFGVHEKILAVDLLIKDPETGNVKAFVEIDSPDRYCPSTAPTATATGKRGRELRRYDQFKEFLYAAQYPGVPFIRVPVTGTEEAGPSVSLPSDLLSVLES